MIIKHVKIISPPTEKHVWYYKHVGDIYEAVLAEYKNLWRVLDFDEKIRRELIKEGIDINLDRDIYINVNDVLVLEHPYKDDIYKILEL